MSEHKVIAVDTETTGLIPWDNASKGGLFHPARPFAISWCWDDETTGYARFKVDPFTREVLYKRKPKTFKKVQQILGDPNTIKVLHHAPFDYKQLIHAGFTIRGPILDTLLMAHIVTHGNEFRYDLKFLGEKWFGFPKDDQEQLEASTKAARQIAKNKGWCIATEEHFGKKPHFADYWLADPELCKRYAVQDAERTMLLYMLLAPKVAKNAKYKAVFDRETALYDGPIKTMEFAGMRVFPNHVDRLAKYYNDYIKKQERVIRKEAYKGFNPNSGPQKIKELVEKRGLEVQRMTQPSKKFPNGQPQVSGHFLQFHAEKENPDPLCRAILEWSNARRAVNGFIKTYRQHMVLEDGVYILHPQIRGIGAITGRLSSHDPNLMNVASETTGRRRSNVALKPRETLGPRPGHMWYLPDFGQLEVWIFAMVSKNQKMLDVLMGGGDFHGEIGKIVFGDEPDYEDRLVYYRKCGKLIIFQTLYGGGIKKLSQTVPCSHEQAKKYKDAYMQRLGNIEQYIHRLGNRARKDGFVSNVYGRHSYVHPDYTYKAVNYLVQGTAADVQKEALINVHSVLKEKWPEARQLMSLHDEQIIELPLHYHCKRLMRDLITCMQRAGEPLQLPQKLPVGVKICRTRWHKTKEIELEVA